MRIKKLVLIASQSAHRTTLIAQFGPMTRNKNAPPKLPRPREGLYLQPRFGQKNSVKLGPASYMARKGTAPIRSTAASRNWGIEIYNKNQVSWPTLAMAVMSSAELILIFGSSRINRQQIYYRNFSWEHAVGDCVPGPKRATLNGVLVISSLRRF